MSILHRPLPIGRAIRVRSGLNRAATRRLHTTPPTRATALTLTTPTVKSHSSLLTLAFGIVVGGSTLILSTMDAESNPGVGAAASTSPVAAAGVTVGAASSESPKKKPNISDLASIDFRTLGVCACPPLPSHAPQWLREQAGDAEFQYRDLGAILDTSNHLIYDALSGERRIAEVYYFVEKTGTAAGSHPTPHLPATLDFEPQTPNGPPKQIKQQTTTTTTVAPTANKSWVASIGSFFSSIWRSTPASAEAAPAAPAAAAISPFTQSSPDVHMSATGPEVRAIFHIGRALCGHKGIVHGGMTAALMDEVSGAATFVAAGGGVFTANVSWERVTGLNINYLKPVRAGQYALVRAQAVKQVGRKTYVNISVEDGVGTVFARGTALYIKPAMLPPAVMVAATQ